MQREFVRAMQRVRPDGVCTPKHAVWLDGPVLVTCYELHPGVLRIHARTPARDAWPAPTIQLRIRSGPRWTPTRARPMSMMLALYSVRITCLREELADSLDPLRTLRPGDFVTPAARARMRELEWSPPRGAGPRTRKGGRPALYADRKPSKSIRMY